MMNSLKDIIQRCHDRHEKPLRQRKTVAKPILHRKFYPYQFTVYCAHRHPVGLDDVEQAAISFMPIGRAPGYDRGPRTFGGKRFLKRQGMTDWLIRRWQASWGLQVYTGIPSERDGARWHDLEFTYQAICAVPDAVFGCIEALINAVANPLLTVTKSGGLRFSCRVPGYLHPSTEQAKPYIYKHSPTPENPHQRDLYLEIFGEEGYSRWDARYEILLGNLLEPPVIAKEVLFAPIDTLRAELHQPAPPGEKQLQPATAAPSFLASRNLDLAKEAFVKRGFSYIQQENGFHRWTRPGGGVGDTDVSLWESDENVWVRAFTHDAGLPMEATPITDVWDDTGILPSIPPTGLPVSDKVLAVREGTLSPLAIKRLPRVLQRLETAQSVYETLERNSAQIQGVFDREVRILGLRVSEAGSGKNHEVESYLLNGGATCLNVPTVGLAEEAEQRYQTRNLPSFARWKSRMYLWEQAKEIPREVRMAAPFQAGNVCEDPERCDALLEKGGNPRESICPQCPVYTECRIFGYLSQPYTLQYAKAQIVAIPQLFFNPRDAAVVAEILAQEDAAERLCIVDEAQARDLFLACEISKNVLRAWSVNWQGEALGNFAKALLNAADIKVQAHGDPAKRMRIVMQAFARQEGELIRQMCQVNVRGKVVERVAVDAETGEEMPCFIIEFKGGALGYIPFTDDAVDELAAKGLPLFRIGPFVFDEDMNIPMAMSQAIRLGILSAETVEGIQEFPTICRDPNWTFWHQLKRFFAYYTRDADAPMWWDNKVLRFSVPPVLHESVQRLLLMSVTLSEQHLRRAFPDDDIGVLRTEPTAWVEGNQVFQICTGVYPREILLSYDSNWDVVGMSKTGQDFFSGIKAEIDRDPSVKHAIITIKSISVRLEDVAEKENVCLVTNFRKMERVESAFKEAQVLWIVGAPQLPQGRIWHQAQILFGNDEKPLSYERDRESHRYKDERVQSVYEYCVSGVLRQAVGLAGLNRLADKKVVLISGLALPEITDRPETLLFDWTDFEVAGGLDKLPEVIATRQHFETEKENLTADSSREKIEHVLGVSKRQANRILERLRGGKIPHVTFREQILTLLVSEGEKKSTELIAAVEGHPTSIRNELKRLVDAGEIVKVRRGVYTLP